ncbi:MAG: hypothetical protein K2F99_01380, partial [Muribaculaceae bacterium]|nr:hypothetical protein [Muribaculaceae bacterium]
MPRTQSEWPDLTDPDIFIHDFDSDAATRNIRFGRSWATINDQIKFFDVAKMPDIDNATMPLMGHVIFTRPSLNILVDGSRSGADQYARHNFEQMWNNGATAGWIRDPVGQSLANMLSANSDTYY